MKSSFLSLTLFVGCIMGTLTTAHAQSPWARFLPFKRVDADPTREYELTKDHGPWMIMAAAFAGKDADKQANELVLELRKRYNLKAFAHNRTFDYTESVKGIGINKYGGDKMMKHRRAVRADEYAVLVGNFNSITDPNLQKTLQSIKTMHPKALEPQDGKPNRQPYAHFRKQMQFATKKTKGPMSKALATTNPLLPDGYFNGQGVDPFVIDLNKGIPYSLLDNPGKFTIKVATFRGAATMDEKEIKKWAKKKVVSNRLVQAEIDANTLATALRKQGVEAYQFHDRDESIVAIGSFDSLGDKLPNGGVRLDAAVKHIMEYYAARKTNIAGQRLPTVEPRVLAGVHFDVQPEPMPVPKKSVGSVYVNR